MKKAFVFFLGLVLSISFAFTALSEQTISVDELDEYISTEYKKTHIPNISVEIVDSDSILFQNNYGENTDSDTPFILGSISKSFTALAILQLAQNGKIDINRPVSDYIPDAVDPDSKTTVKQLLNHTSGIATNMTMENFSMSDSVSDYEYANVNYNLLGLIVERISGITYGEYIRQYIFVPLGMTNSYTSLENAKQDGITEGHRNYFGFMISEEFPYPQDMTSGWMTVSAAYLISTANDLGKYLQFWLAGDASVLSDEYRLSAFTDTAAVIDGYEYGFGWGISRSKDITMYVHGGNVENYTTYMVLLPDIGKAVILLTDACDYFASNDMVIKLAENIGCKLSGVETEDIGSNAYLKTHIILDIVMLLILMAAILPLITFRKWHKHLSVRFRSVTFIVLIHLFLPSMFLLVPAMLGSRIWVGLRFAPDLTFILLASGIILYLTGLVKVLCVIKVFTRDIS